MSNRKHYTSDPDAGSTEPTVFDVGDIDTTEDLRKSLVKGIDGLLESVIAARFLSEESKKLLRAQRRFWSDDKTQALPQLLYLYHTEP